MEYLFCDLFIYGKRLYLAREMDANGPGVMVFPPEEISGINVLTLGVEIEKALNDYQKMGRSIYADEWEKRNQELLSFFNEKCISNFEKKKKNVTIRKTVETNEICLFGPKNKVVTLDNTDSIQLSEEIGKLINLKSVTTI